MPISRALRTPVICLTLLLAFTTLGASAKAQTSEPAPSGAIKPGENPRRATGILKATFATGMAALGSMTAVAGGLLLGFAATDSGPFGEVLLDERGSAVALGSSVAFFSLLVPASTAVAVHGIAKIRGVPGTYRGAWLGSLVTSLTIGLPWLALSAIPAEDRQGPRLASLGITIAHGMVGAVVGAMVGETWSRNRRLRARLVPSIPGQRGGLGLGLSGQF